jgi:hypothetical protein
VFPNLRGVIERSREIFNPQGLQHGRDSYNESLHRWRLADGRQIEFESCQWEKDKEKQRGRPRDFMGFDEATEFPRTIIEFIMGWLRSTIPGQRSRVVLTFNPPVNETGTWVIDYFLPWLAYLFPTEFDHPNPAAPGELRWFAVIDGREQEFMTGESFHHEDELIEPMSRTFIPSRLQDNPKLRDTGYRSILQSMPEPLRSQLLYGDFTASAEANPWQVIPTAWVKAAQSRWMEREQPDMPVSGMGLDVARGGKDELAIARRYGTWYAEVIKVPGVDVEDGPAAAGLVFHAIEDEAHVGYLNIDVIGVGSSAYDSLKAMYPESAVPINVAKASDYVAMTKEDKPRPLFKMKNVRAEMHWRMREVLDPVHGDGIALPPGNEVLADLCAAQYEVLAGGVIKIEKKEHIKDRIGRSPDVGEAIMMANMQPIPPPEPAGEQVDVGTDPYKAGRRSRGVRRMRR